MSGNQEGHRFSSELLVIGTSIAFGITALAGQQSVFVTATGGSLLVGGVTVVANHALIPQPFDARSMRGTFYMSAAGATATVHIVRVLSADS